MKSIFKNHKTILEDLIWPPIGSLVSIMPGIPLYQAVTLNPSPLIISKQSSPSIAIVINHFKNSCEVIDNGQTTFYIDDEIEIQIEDQIYSVRPIEDFNPDSKRYKYKFPLEVIQ